MTVTYEQMNRCSYITHVRLLTRADAQVHTGAWRSLTQLLRGKHPGRDAAEEHVARLHPLRR